MVGRTCTTKIEQYQKETHLGSGVSRVILREIDFAESPFAEKFIRYPHLVLGDLNLIELTSPPGPANFL